MKQLLTIFAAALLTFTVSAAERITATITVTNTPVTGNSLTINSALRYWTNASAAGTILTNLTGKNAATTNLYNQIASYPYSGGLILRWSTTNAIQLIGPLSGALAGSISGNWGTLTLSTQSGPQTYTALYPLENIIGATNRTNQASSLVSGISSYSTNAFTTNAAAMSNFVTKGASALQEVIAPALFSGGLRGANVRLTNGFTSAMTNINPVTSNLVNYGNAIRSEGSGGNSFQAGSNAVAAGSLSVAIGNGSVASNTTTLAIGTDAKATNSYAMAVGNGAIAGGGSDALAMGRSAQALGSSAMAIGQGSIAQGTAPLAIQSEVVGDNSIGIGPSSSVSATNSTALGSGATITHNDSTAIGRNATTTTTNQIRLGTSTETVSIPGIVDGPTTTNATLRGTNVVNGRVDFTSRANTGLANGNNASVVLGTNVFVRLSGPTGNYTLNGFAAEQDGSFHILELDNPTSSITVANNSGTDPTAANRITTGTGADVTITNNPAFLQVIYNSTASRWRVISYSR